MAYEMKLTRNHLAIAEQEHCTSHTIQFTSIDSCIGVIACDGQSLTAAHLVLISKSGVAFGSADLVDVMKVFDKRPYNEIVFVGELGNWNLVTDEFHAKSAATEFDFKEIKGHVRASISNKGKIVVRRGAAAIGTQGIGIQETSAQGKPAQESRPRSKSIPD